MTWTTSGCQFKAFDVINNSCLWLTWMTPGHKLKALNAMNGLGLWLTWMNLGHEVSVMDAMNSLRLWMIWTTRDAMSSILYMLWTTQSCGWHELLQVMMITTQKVLFYTFKSLCFKHFCVVILHLYSNWHVKDLAMTPNHICGYF